MTYAKVFKDSAASAKAWGSRKRTSKEFWAKGPDGKAKPAMPAKKDDRVARMGTIAASLGIPS